MSIKSIALIAILALLTQSFAVLADDIQFTASAPRVVEVGEQFRLTYTINAKGDNISVPDIEGFSVLSGPNRSTSTSIQSINGSFTQTIQNSFTYILMAEKEGKFTIPGAKVKINNKVVESNSISIEVVKGGQSGKTSTSQSNSSQGQVQAEGGSRLFAAVNVTKKEVYIGESLTADVKIYTKEPLAGLEDSKMPAFNGFWSQDFETPSQISLQRENVNGEIYESGLFKKTLLFPQRSGEIEIEPFEVTLLVRKKVRSNNPFDDFFGGSYATSKVKIASKPIKIKVKPLPENKPLSFGGGVGSFTMNATIDNQNVKANDAITLKVTISGTGNLKLIKPLKIDFPPDFELYDPKTKQNVDTKNGESKGSVTFEYLVIPRHSGDFRIAPIEFSYFDLNTKTYKTYSSKEFNIHVEKGENDTETTSGVVSAYTKEDIKYIGKDIRYLKKEVQLYKKQSFLFGSKFFYLSYVIGLILFIAILILYRAQIKQRADQAKMKNRKANKISQKRLKLAASHMKQNQKERFYDEILKSIWGYLSDKLSVSIAELTKDNVSDILKNRGVSDDIIKEVLELLNTCEFARYAPASISDNMTEVYRKAESCIGKLDQKVK